MEKSNKIQRSEVWEQIYKVVSKIPRKDVEGDAADAPSVATELEKLFLKLLPIHDVMHHVCPDCNGQKYFPDSQQTTGQRICTKCWGTGQIVS